MAEITQPMMVASLVELLDEAFVGPKDPKMTWFVSNEAGSGLFGTIEKLSPQQAWAPPVEGARSIAHHVDHVRFWLAYGNAWFRGETPRVDWEQSWNPGQMGDAGWRQLQARTREEFETFRRFTAERQDWSPPLLNGAMAGVAHTAYHLGAIRQILRIVGKGG